MSKSRIKTELHFDSVHRWLAQILTTFFLRDWGWLLTVVLAYFTLRVGFLWHDRIFTAMDSRAATAAATAILLLIPVALICCSILGFCIQQVVSNYRRNVLLGINPPTVSLIAEYDFTQFLRSALVYCSGGFVIVMLLVAWTLKAPLLQGVFDPPTSYLELWFSSCIVVKRFFGE